MMKRRLFSITTALFVAMTALSLFLLLGASYQSAEMADSEESGKIDTVSIPFDDTGSGLSSISQPASTEETAGWVIECVDCPESESSNSPPDTPSLGDISFAFDSTGSIHVVHQNIDGQLEYLFQDGDFWHTVVLTTGMGYPDGSASLVLDENDNPHLAFYVTARDTLQYAYYDGSEWHFEEVDTFSWYASLALDSNGDPHITYLKTSDEVTYAYRDQHGWQRSLIQSLGYFQGKASSLILDSSDTARVGYVHNKELRYATFNGSSWISQTLDSDATWRDHELAMVIDDDDYIRFSYHRESGGELGIAYQDASGWHTDTVDARDEVGLYSAMVLNNSDYGAISYYDATAGDLNFAYQDANGWYTATVDTVDDVGLYTSLDLDKGGYPHIFYLDQTNEKLNYSYKDATGWHIPYKETLVLGLVSGLSSLDLDGYDNPHISYYDEDQKDLKYAHKLAGRWVSETVDSAGDVGTFTSIGVGGDGHPRISYYDETNKDLKFARWDGATWHIDTIDSGGDVGRYASLALEPTAPYTPHISYSDDTNRHPKYAHLAPSGWISETVGRPFRGGHYTSLALDPNGLVHISYFEYATVGALIHQRQLNPSTWNTPTVVDWYTEIPHVIRVTGLYGSLALDSAGNPYIAYHDNFVPALMLAYGEFQYGWINRKVITYTYSFPTDISLAVDGEKRHISFFDFYGEDDLKYALKDGPLWVIQSIDSGPGVGVYTSLALDSSGNPHISYFDVKQGYLKYARISTAPVANFSATPTAGPKPLTVHFSDASAGGMATSWLWSFDDGQTSSQQNPSHIYQDTGLYSVKLTVAGPDGSDAITKTDYINVVEPALADFSGSPTSGLAPLSVDYINLSSGNFSTCQWNFGDGESSNACTDPSHIYQLPGLYTVTLSIDGTGGPSVESKMAYINANHPTPQVDFTAAPRSGETPLEVAFTSVVTGTVDDYQWSFGDGGEAHSANPTHTYHLAGTFSVTLLITGPGGADQVHYPNYIVVDPSPNAPQAEFSANLISGTVPLTVTFTAVITGSVESWEWDFGDGQKAFSGPVVEHTYLNPGLYDVSLTVSNNHGGVIIAKNEYITAIKGEPEDQFIFLPVVIKGGS